MRGRRRRLVLRRRLRLRKVISTYFRRTVFIRPAVNHRLEIEVAVARRTGRLPFECVGVPRISTRGRSEEYAVEEIQDEDDLRGYHQHRANGHELVERQQVFEG